MSWRYTQIVLSVVCEAVNSISAGLSCGSSGSLRRNVASGVRFVAPLPSSAMRQIAWFSSPS
jgi:hypothetical protein